MAMAGFVAHGICLMDKLIVLYSA